VSAETTSRTEAETLDAIGELAAAVLRKVRRGGEISPRLLDVDDAGRYLAMSDKGVRELIMQGEIPFIQKVPGRSPYLLDVRDLDLWIEKHKRRP
jgi:excisionase family DNA binding protein